MNLKVPSWEGVSKMMELKMKIEVGKFIDNELSLDLQKYPWKVYQKAMERYKFNIVKMTDINQPNEKGYFCCICNNLITKYQMDLKCCEIKRNGYNQLICDDCAKDIALYVVEEF